MLEQIQRDLFAVGARLADPSHRIAGRVTKAAVSTEDVARLERWIDALDAVLPPLRRFILAGGVAAGAALHVARTVCRRAERAMVQLGEDAFETELLQYVNRLSDLLFTMARAVNHRAGIAGNRVVSASAAATSPRSCAAPTMPARSWRARHYENFPVASLLLPRRMRRAIAAVYAFARRADDFADEPGYRAAERLRLLDDWQRRLDAGRRRHRAAPANRRRSDLRRRRGRHRERTSCRSRCSHDLLSAFRQDVTMKRYETWDDVLDYCSPLGQPGRPAGAAHRRPRDDALDRRVGRALHRAAADEFLAGFRARLGRTAGSTCRGRIARRSAPATPISKRPSVIRTPRPPQAPLPAEWRAVAARDDAPHATAVHRAAVRCATACSGRLR